MATTISQSLGQPLAIIAATILFAGCASDAPLAPDEQVMMSARSAAESGKKSDPIGTLRRVTARYHDLNAAIADGFVFLHDCETRGDEGPVGILYVHFDRLLDGVIDPSKPDALLYEPRRKGPPRLVGVELAVPYALWTGPQPPRFMGAAFQREDEFGVYGLHAWVWKKNPEGMFAESNPRVSCAED